MIYRYYNYCFLYLQGNVTVDTREVEPNMRECTFNVLTPGRLYTITVTTRSWKLNTSVSLEGRTGVFMCFCICEGSEMDLKGINTLIKYFISAAIFQTFTTLLTLIYCKWSINLCCFPILK